MYKAIVTGHSRGLGAALANELLARGGQVLGISRAGNPGLAANYPGAFQELALDLSDQAGLASFLASGRLERFLAGADLAVLINNAGVLQPMGAPGRQGGAAIALAVTANVAAPLMLSDAFVAATSNLSDRRIAHVSSGAARSAYAGWSVYCATKAALDMHARAVKADALPGLRISSIAPGVIDTAMQAEIRAAESSVFPLHERFEALKHKGELATPEDTARRFVGYLLSAAFGQDPAPDLRTLVT